MPASSPVKILLVDDTDANRYAMSRVLRKEGFHVIEAVNGREALQLAVVQPQPDLILLDVRLPDLSGFETCAQLKENPATMATPVLQLSAVYVRDEDKVQGLQSGADAYLTGPVEPPVLLATVRALLRVRQTEATLREREERLRLALDAARMGTWDWDLRTGMFTLSTNFEMAAGLGPGTFGGTYEAFLTMVHPSDRPEVDQMISCALAEGVPYDMEFRLVRPEGTVWWAASKGKVFTDTAGQAIRMVGVAMDITARKEAEEALAVSEQRRRTLAEALPALVWMARPDGFFDYYNQRWYDYTGLSESQLAGWGWQAVWHPDDLPEGRARWLEALNTGQPYESQARIRRATDASYRWHLIRAVPVHDAVGRVVQWFGTNTDIEDQKQTAAELQRINTELQQFSHIVSHDLNEPLRTMSNFVTLLAQRYQGKLDAPAEEYISFVTDASQRMQQMITDLLAYTRVGGPTETLTVVDGEALLTRVLSELQVAIADAKGEVTHDPLPTVLGDATRLGQVLQNLIGNALKFRSQAPPRIHVSAQREGQHWRFSVRDNGIGIDPQQAPRLFQVFQRLHTRSEYPGTGIGLAICKKIVEQHGGRMWVESRPGEESIFYFTVSDIKKKEE